MATILHWPTLAGVVLTYYATLAFYRLFFHPLARFPGPKLAAVSRWYEAYYDVILGGKYTAKIAKLHESYGPIIRISPYELHVSDPAFYDTIYRSDGHWDKYSWTYDAFGAELSTVFGWEHHTHKMRRRAIAPFFSKAKVNSRQSIIHRNINKLSRRISDLSGSTFNLGAAISAFARDSANEFITGKSYNDLDKKDFGIGLSISSQGAGVFWRTTKHIRWFGPALRGLPIEWALKVADDGTKSFLRYLQQSEHDAQETLAAATSPDQCKTVENTLTYAIVNSDLPPAEKSFERVFTEIATATGAGFESTANILRLIVFHVYTNNDILRKLRREIASAHTTSSQALTLPELERLPYFTAVLMEGMRLSPAVASRTARITNKDLFYENWRIPAGIPVGMTTILMHTDEKLYPDPMSFDPDRWAGSDVRREGGPNFAPFSKGTRMCLGMHLAWAEMYLFLAALVQGFTFTIQEAEARDFQLEKDNFNIGTKAGCNLMVRVSPYEE